MITQHRHHLLTLLTERACGALEVQDRSTPVVLYLFAGEVLGASAEDDDERLVRRLLTGRHLRESQLAHLQRLAGDDPISLVLWEVLPEALTQQLVADRFRENLGRFLACNGATVFSPMTSLLGVPNLHFEHDTQVLVSDLETLIERSAALRSRAGMATLVHRAHPKPKDQCERTLWLLISDETTVSDIVEESPYEELDTLDVIVSMLDRGSVEAHAVGMDVEDVDDEEDLLADFGRATRAPDSIIEIEDDDETGEYPTLARRTADAAVEEEEAPEEPQEEPQEEPESQTVDDEDADSFNASPDAGVYAQELAMFADHDEFRGAGKEGHFSKTQEELDVDRIDLSDAEPPVQPAPKAVSAEPKMNFGGPTLSKEDALRKIEVANEVLLGLSTAFDQQSSKGAGPAKTQVLLDGSPSEFAALFQAIKVDAVTGTPSPQAVLSNLNRRPDSEHRRLLNRGLSDLIERAMNLADESLDDEHIEAFLEGCVGYRTRLGL